MKTLFLSLHSNDTFWPIEKMERLEFAIMISFGVRRLEMLHTRHWFPSLQAELSPMTGGDEVE